MSSVPAPPDGSHASSSRHPSRIAALGRRTILLPLIALASFEVVVVGIGGGYLAHWLGFPYVALGLISLVVYFTAGFVARRGGGSSALAGGLIALAESGLWAAGVQLGPPPDSGPTAILAGVLFTVFIGMLIGALGGALAARRTKGR